MDQLEENIQKRFVNFSKGIPTHIEKWTFLLQNAEKSAEALLNYMDQLYHIKKADIANLEEFIEIQEHLEFKLSQDIEDEIFVLKDIVAELNTINHELKNKLLLFEGSTTDLNWESNCEVIIGNGIQPSLRRSLEDGYNFCFYFTKAVKYMKDQLDNFNITDRRSTEELKHCFKLDLNNIAITNLLSITQYVINEKRIV